jgi:hypothetical protein
MILKTKTELHYAWQSPSSMKQTVGKTNRGYGDLSDRQVLRRIT